LVTALKGDSLPDDDHIIRHCSGRSIERDPDTLEPIGVTKDAFDDDDPDGISVTWVEYFAAAPDPEHAAMQAVRASPRTVRSSHRFGKFNIGRIKLAGSDAGVPLSVEHDPISNNPGHSLLKGLLPEIHTALMNRLALEMVALLTPPTSGQAAVTPPGRPV
jgi:hypothetical protein